MYINHSARHVFRIARTTPKIYRVPVLRVPASPTPFNSVNHHFSNTQHTAIGGVSGICNSRAFSQSPTQRNNIDSLTEAGPSRTSQPRNTARNVGLVALIAILSFAAGSYTTLTTITSKFLPKMTDAQSASAFVADDEHQKEVEEYLNSHPLVQELRSKPHFAESRPHLRFSEEARKTSLTAGVLSGPGRIVVPPIVFLEEAGTLVSIAYLGTDVCGYPGYVHGGLLATILDETLARCSFAVLPNKIGMTASLNLTYKKPTVAGQYVVIRAKVVKQEGRKAWVEGHIETLPRQEGEEPVVLVEASGLFIEPKQVKLMALVAPVSA